MAAGITSGAFHRVIPLYPGFGVFIKITMMPTNPFFIPCKTLKQRLFPLIVFVCYLFDRPFITIWRIHLMTGTEHHFTWAAGRPVPKQGMVLLATRFTVRAADCGIIILQHPINTHVRHMAAAPMGTFHQQAAWSRKHHTVLMLISVLKSAVKLAGIVPIPHIVRVLFHVPAFSKQSPGQQI